MGHTVYTYIIAVSNYYLFRPPVGLTVRAGNNGKLVNTSYLNVSRETDVPLYVVADY